MSSLNISGSSGNNENTTLIPLGQRMLLKKLENIFTQLDKYNENAQEKPDQQLTRHDTAGHSYTDNKYFSFLQNLMSGKETFTLDDLKKLITLDNYQQISQDLKDLEKSIKEDDKAMKRNVDGMFEDAMQGFAEVDKAFNSMKKSLDELKEVSDEDNTQETNQTPQPTDSTYLKITMAKYDKLLKELQEKDNTSNSEPQMGFWL